MDDEEHKQLIESRRTRRSSFFVEKSGLDVIDIEAKDPITQSTKGGHLLEMGPSEDNVLAK